MARQGAADAGALSPRGLAAVDRWADCPEMGLGSFGIPGVDSKPCTAAGAADREERVCS